MAFFLFFFMPSFFGIQTRFQAGDKFAKRGAAVASHAGHLGLGEDVEENTGTRAKKGAKMEEGLGKTPL